MKKNKCQICGEYFDDSEIYEYRGFLFCQKHKVFYKIMNEFIKTKLELKEKLAEIEHQRWADWQAYCHSKCYDIKGIDGEPTGDIAIPKESVEHWEQQIQTPYGELSEKEKDSDREQVDRYWHLIENLISQYKSKVIEAMGKPLDEASKRTEQELTQNEIAFIRGYNTHREEALNNIDKI